MIEIKLDEYTYNTYIVCYVDWKSKMAATPRQSLNRTLAMAKYLKKSLTNLTENMTEMFFVLLKGLQILLRNYLADFKNGIHTNYCYICVFL